MTDERPKLILSPFNGPHTPGAVVITADCGHQTWISMGGIESQSKMNAITICMECVDPADVPEFVVTPEVYRDLINAVGQEEADKLIELAQNPAVRATMLGGGRRAHKGRSSKTA